MAILALLSATCELQGEDSPKLLKLQLGLSITSDSGKIVTCGERILIIDAATGERIRSLEAPWKEKGWAARIECSPTRPNVLALALKNGEEWEIRIMQMGQAAPVRTLKGHKGHIQELVFTPDGKSLASASTQAMPGETPGQLRVWDVESGELRRSLNRKRGGVRGVSISRGGKLLAFGSGPGLEVMEMEPWEPVGAVQLPSGDLKGDLLVLASTFVGEGEQLYVSGGICVPSKDPNSCQPMGLLWQVRLDGPASLIDSLKPECIDSFDVTPDGREFVSGRHEGAEAVITLRRGDDGAVVWESREQRTQGGIDRIADVKIAPDGRFVAWCNGDEIYVTNAHTGERIHKIKVMDED